MSVERKKRKESRKGKMKKRIIRVKDNEDKWSKMYRLDVVYSGFMETEPYTERD